MPVENVSWFGKLAESIKGVLFGVLLVLGSFPLLFWNEGRAVRRAQDLEEGREHVVEASADAIDTSHDGSLVHLTGGATTTATLNDPVLGPSAPGSLRLRRTVEMYQWREEERTRTKKRTGGGERRTTTFEYRLEWSSTPIDSSRFEEASAHPNPPMPIQSESFDAPLVTVGSRVLSPALIAQIDAFQMLPVQPAQVQTAPLGGRAAVASSDGVYFGANPNAPQLGDLRIRWEVANAGPVSILAAQAGNGFADWSTPSGRTLEQNLDVGVVSAGDMFGELEAGNNFLTWLLRFVGWLMMFIGFGLVFRPLVAVADVLPILGSVVGAGTFLVSLVLSAPLSLLTIAIGWIVYRPLLAIGLLLVGGLIAGGVGFMAARVGKSKNAQRAAQRV